MMKRCICSVFCLGALLLSSCNPFQQLERISGESWKERVSARVVFADSPVYHEYRGSGMMDFTPDNSRMSVARSYWTQEISVQLLHDNKVLKNKIPISSPYERLWSGDFGTAVIDYRTGTLADFDKTPDVKH